MRPTNVARYRSPSSVVNGSAAMPSTCTRQPEIARVSDTNSPCGRSGRMSPEVDDRQNVDPSMRVIIPQSPDSAGGEIPEAHAPVMDSCSPPSRPTRCHLLASPGPGAPIQPRRKHTTASRRSWGTARHWSWQASMVTRAFAWLTSFSKHVRRHHGTIMRLATVFPCGHEQQPMGRLKTPMLWPGGRNHSGVGPVGQLVA